nr:hypothetical protein [Tanacetum cinerariifolium]
MGCVLGCDILLDVSFSREAGEQCRVRKRYLGTSELILDTDSEGDELGEEDKSSNVNDERENDEGQGLDKEVYGLVDEGQGLEVEGHGMEEEEEAAPEGQPQAVLVVKIAASEPLGLRYGADRRRSLELTKEIAPSTYETQPSPEWSLGSLLVPPSSSVVPSPIASTVATPSATISIEEDQFLEVEEQLELYKSILYDHTHHFDVLPPTLFEGYDRDLRELYTRKNHDLRGQLAEERRERLKLTDRVARIERRHESKGE